MIIAAESNGVCRVHNMLAVASAECVLERTINQSPKLATIKTLSVQKGITKFVRSGAYLHDNPKIFSFSMVRVK